MGFRDRFFTPTTARAILSWRLAVGLAVGMVAAVAGLHVLAAIGLGLAVYVGTVLVAVPNGPRAAAIDPFTVGEPWRQFVQSAQRSRRRLAATVDGTAAGPLRDRLADITARLESAVDESWAVAKRGDEIDHALTALDPTRLRSNLTTLQTQVERAPTENLTAAIASVESQLASAGRLRALSASTADRLRLTQARLDELVARAAEVSVGSSDTDTYAHDVDDLVTELEGLHQAVQELPR
ncbi:MAG: hypothetical protein H0U21_06205 [Acidimicrobiia bacterium]|nr:hypothetical protein [Acidimicrobiia bacterium]